MDQDQAAETARQFDPSAPFAFQPGYAYVMIPVDVSEPEPVDVPDGFFPRITIDSEADRTVITTALIHYTATLDRILERTGNVEIQKQLRLVTDLIDHINQEG